MSTAPLTVTAVRFTPARAAEAQTGLLGFARITLENVVEIDGVAVRRTAAGRLALSFPARDDRRGRRHPLVRAGSPVVRCDLERQVLDALGLEEVAP